ncbi:PREDICTED: uncharacterized protein LOC106329672 [Brassica oleracea var. oleracea]|uniref:uncharacterized protein LOC106329672 n=1 Tax=Brassica oleracea var. oleracea TaxID=109376 RepID=UPI0006A74828|nr:PREDICTED: uncharacterized protein LOC106329672 [Brassica oleracea var. oleracea]
MGLLQGLLAKRDGRPHIYHCAASFVSEDEVPSDQYAFRLGGITVKENSKLGPRPEIEIYEFEGCPFCRKVREMVGVLDLDILYYPCPRGSPNFRPKVNQMGGKQQFPYMVDPNTGVSMYESDGTIKYMSEKYGDGTVPLSLTLGPLTVITAGFAMIGRLGKMVRPSWFYLSHNGSDSTLELHTSVSEAPDSIYPQGL